MLVHSAFYQFVHISQPEDFALWLRKISDGINGSILVASEGINGTIAGTLPNIERFENRLKHHSLFEKITFKHSACTTPPFGLFRVHVKPEIVQMGVANVDAIEHQPNAVSPQKWAELIEKDDIVLLDNRNRFEFDLGHFKGAVNPNVSHFKDFPEYVEAHLPQWQAAGKRVAMYCTGGIRCDKTSAWLSKKGVDSFVLEGGILNFLKHQPGSNLFEGECFVFDNRLALNTHLAQSKINAEQVFAKEPDAQWRIARANKLLASAAVPSTKVAVNYTNNLPRSKVVTTEGAYKTVLEFFVARFDHVTQDQWQQRFTKNEVTNDLGKVVLAQDSFRSGMVLFYNRAVEKERPIPFEATTVYEDEFIVVADKPHFLSVAPSGDQVNETLLMRLRQQLNCSTLSPAHRIDRDTAGLVLFTKQKAHRGLYQNLFRDRFIHKVYWAVAAFNKDLQLPLHIHNRLERSAQHFMQAASTAGLPNAETYIELCEHNTQWGLYRLIPSTGQRHQLRVHMNELGLPILNDEIYPSLQPEIADTDEAWSLRYQRPLQLLAKTLSFSDPFTHQDRLFESNFKLQLPPVSTN
jgi:UPF0176 protein